MNLLALVSTAAEVAGQEASQTVAPALVKGQSAADLAAQLVQVILSLGVVLGFIFALVWFFKRQKGFNLPQREMKLIERLSLGQKEQLVLVEVAGVRLLLGVNPGGINRLHEYQAPEQDGESTTPAFSNYLNQVLQSKVTP